MTTIVIDKKRLSVLKRRLLAYRKDFENQVLIVIQLVLISVWNNNSNTHFYK